MVNPTHNTFGSQQGDAFVASQDGVDIPVPAGNHRWQLGYLEGWRDRQNVPALPPIGAFLGGVAVGAAALMAVTVLFGL
jgi:hypothetical protein